MAAIRVTVEMDMPADQGLVEIAHIMDNLRRATIYWDKHYGAVNRANKKYWEDRADAWREKYIKRPPSAEGE